VILFLDNYWPLYVFVPRDTNPVCVWLSCDVRQCTSI